MRRLQGSTRTPTVSRYRLARRRPSRPPSPRAVVSGGAREETSLGAELGLRWSPLPFFRAELAGFWTDFDDLLVLENIGSGGSSRDENVGDVITYGLELGVRFDPALWRGWSFDTRSDMPLEAESWKMPSVSALHSRS